MALLKKYELLESAIATAVTELRAAADAGETDGLLDEEEAAATRAVASALEDAWRGYRIEEQS